MIGVDGEFRSGAPALMKRFRFRTLIFSPPTRNSDREYPRHAKTTTIHLRSTAAFGGPSSFGL
jgi:hypothetical protein